MLDDRVEGGVGGVGAEQAEIDSRPEFLLTLDVLSCKRKIDSTPTHV